ncbi:Alpha/Beta hydrolase protein [Phakopsora pachyrhizi]|uniref:Alpha/Beta hydrolase protein n=1 Tax=Phakopsora pachyrhizi TaxID=170000 RepID=A0AAV0AWI7_PHAPC|nr:Alpha/Beta hydrolase protein [Phakopsora pachyrhizi]
MLPVSPAVIGGNITDDNHLGVSLNNPTTNVSVGAGGHEVPVGSKPPGIDINVGTHPSRLRLRSSSSDPTSTTIPLTSGSQRSNSTTEQIQDSSKKIFFWFFPATAVEGTNKLTLWVNGGPGCSSMIGALTESGPVRRASPSKNIYSWTNSSSILYVEDNTGYSTSSSKSIEDLSKNILGFLKNWLRVFPEMSPMKLYITGEAYAGLTIPFIADYILSNPDEIPNKLKGLLLFNPVLTYDAIQMQVPTYPFIQYNQRFFRLNETTMAHLSKIHKDCGYEDYINKYLSFPPSVNSSAPAPTSIYDVDGHKTKRCDVWQYVSKHSVHITIFFFLVNPSFNPYLISQTLQPFSILRLPATFNQSLPGQIESAYFDRKDVKKVLHAQSNSNWSSCSNPSELVPRQGFNPASTSTVVLAKVINKLKRTVIVHGSLDFRVISNGTLIALQNMTWGGTQGFQSPINLPFFVPGQGTLGKYVSVFLNLWNTERNLSFVELEGSGESVPESEPKASLMIFKYLIGDFNSISNSTENFKKTIMNNSNVPNLANQSVNFTSASLSSIGFSNSSNTSSNQTTRDYSGVVLSNSSTGTPKAYSPQTVDSTNLTLHLDSGSASPSVSANPRPGPSDTAVQPNSNH